VKGRLVWLDNLLRDLRMALRQLRRSPGFARLLFFTLALGLPRMSLCSGCCRQWFCGRWMSASRPVMTLTVHQSGGPVLAYPEVRDVRDDIPCFLLAADVVQNFGLEANGITRPVWGYEERNTSKVVGLKPFLGRLLERSDDDHPEPRRPAVLSWPAWKNYIGADPTSWKDCSH